MCSLLTEHHAMEAYWGGGIAPRITDLGTIFLISYRQGTPRAVAPKKKKKKKKKKKLSPCRRTVMSLARKVRNASLYA
jgi:hypothetical protein